MPASGLLAACASLPKYSTVSGGAGEGAGKRGVARAGMDEHGGVELVEGAALRHYRLAAVDLLRRRADGGDASAGLGQDAA